MNRRGFLQGLLVTPAIVKYGSLMPIFNPDRLVTAQLLDEFGNVLLESPRFWGRQGIICDLYVPRRMQAESLRIGTQTLSVQRFAVLGDTFRLSIHGTELWSKNGTKENPDA